MDLNVQNVRSVAETRMCCGCGVCAYLDPDQIEMVDDIDQGRRPVLRTRGRFGLRSMEAMHACPGIELTRSAGIGEADLIRELLPAWGPVLEVWEGHASDPNIRHAGSSGGVITALAAFCVERAGMRGVLHTASRRDVPYLNRTVLSRSRAEILAGSGSRYAPASPCDGLQRVEDASGPCVFVGKPCDVAAATKAAALRPRLSRNLALTVAAFCAGTPSTRGTLELIQRMGIAHPSHVAQVRYRGNGWPGETVVVTRAGKRSQMTYEQSWGGVLAHHIQWRCRLCADHTGEFADIAVGDPWYRPADGADPGRSLVLVRTERGRKLLRDAGAAGFLVLARAAPGALPASQPSLLRTRVSVWGRIFGLRLIGAAAPRYRGFGLLAAWWSHLTLSDKARSIYGTIRRALVRGLRRKVLVQPYVPAEYQRL